MQVSAWLAHCIDPAIVRDITSTGECTDLADDFMYQCKLFIRGDGYGAMSAAVMSFRTKRTEFSTATEFIEAVKLRHKAANDLKANLHPCLGVIMLMSQLQEIPEMRSSIDIKNVELKKFGDPANEITMTDFLKCCSEMQDKVREATFWPYNSVVATTNGDPMRAGQKQSVLDGFFPKSQGLVPRAPSPNTTGQSAETPFDKSDKGPEQGGDDGWEADWVSDVDEKDDYSHEMVGDDKVLPGPEGEVCSDSIAPHQISINASTAETTEINGQLFKTIQEIVEFLKKWASETEFTALRDKPITRGFWSLIGRLSDEFIMRLRAPAIDPKVQALFEKGTFSVDDLRKLPRASSESRPGVYLGFILDEIHSDGTVTLALYVGSSMCCKFRVQTHQSRRTGNRLKRSAFYQRLMKGEKVEFCLLAAFDCSIETGYLNLLEAIFMFLFGTLLEPTFETDFVKQSTWELYEQLQSVIRPHYILKVKLFA
ncbi:hypothetical protein VN97_g8300 [Penicillium thymicola]|uniref:Uncharacterized protein n=1 Tax=Penicillium thymicola TaxID=293382 RepID=A0AAI9TD04_PENTH|nr:hypothetical protein VN97_g8300 [Penicillium thymicola]